MSDARSPFRRLEAFLALIRYAEHGQHDSPSAYSSLFGGGHFTGWKQHPAGSATRWGKSSTAAGAYQIEQEPYEEAIQRHVAHDFSPSSQDAIAIYLIDRKHAKESIYDGNLDEAFERLKGTWSSLPGGSQQELSSEEAKKYFWRQAGETPPADVPSGRSH